MHRTFVVALALFAAAATVLAEPQKPGTPPPAQKPQEGVLTPPQQTPVIRRSVDLVTTDLVVRDDQGQFVSSLSQKDFDVYEDGVKQSVISFVLFHGGRLLNDSGAPPPPRQEGLLRRRRGPPTTLRAHLPFFVDDLHMDFRNTGAFAICSSRSGRLIHEGDVWHRVDRPLVDRDRQAYDRKRLGKRSTRSPGSGLKPDEIIERRHCPGPPEIGTRARRVLDNATC